METENVAKKHDKARARQEKTRGVIAMFQVKEGEKQTKYTFSTVVWWSQRSLGDLLEVQKKNIAQEFIVMGACLSRYFDFDK